MTQTILSRAALRAAAENKDATPSAAIAAVNALLDSYGVSDRNLRIARRVCKRFRKFAGDTEIGQRRIRWAAEQLAARLERIAENGPMQPEDVGGSVDSAPLDEPSVPTPKQIIGGIEQLPPNECDPGFWDGARTGCTRRELFYTAWGLPATSTRAEFLEACRAHPEKVAANILEVKTWAQTRAQLDGKYAADLAVVRAALTERRLEDTDAGREELAEQVVASGEPLVEFRPREQEGIYEVGPQLVRSKAGLLLDAIAFTKSWPQSRHSHRPL